MGGDCCCRERGKRRPLSQKDSAGLWEVCTGVRRAELAESHPWLAGGRGFRWAGGQMWLVCPFSVLDS